MKKIEFGFSNDLEPKGSWEGIGIAPGNMLTSGEYYGAISIDGDSYIIAKASDKFISRQALCDIYADGSTVIFLNQEQNNNSINLEYYLNSEQIKETITTDNVESIIINSDPRAHIAPKSFKIATLDESITTTSITPDAFVVKNEALKNCHTSISELQNSLSSEYTR